MGQNFSSEPVVEKDTERAHNDLFNVAVSSCQGWRMSQEDNHSLMLELPGEHKAAFFAVYDGHGSARVSKHASEALFKHLTQNELYKQGNFKEALEQAFLTFDREVNESYNAQLAGTTAICVLIVDNVIYCANIGDSRAVAAVNCECIPLSHDHKPENSQELKRILAAGGYVLGNRVNGNLALSRAFGDFHYKGNEQLPPDQQIVSPCPDIKRIELNDELDFLVLACDGIWDVLTSEEVVEFVISRLEHNVEPALICEQLTTRCLATDYELVIGCDNMTVLLVCHTRGRSWEDYCTDIFEKNTKKLGVAARTRTFQDIETLNREVQLSRLRTNPLINQSDTMNEMQDFTTSPSSTGSSSLFDIMPTTNDLFSSGSDANDGGITISAGGENRNDYSNLEMVVNEARMLQNARFPVRSSPDQLGGCNANENDWIITDNVPAKRDNDDDKNHRSTNTTSAPTKNQDNDNEEDNQQQQQQRQQQQQQQTSSKNAAKEVVKDAQEEPLEPNISAIHLSSLDTDGDAGVKKSTTTKGTTNDLTEDPTSSTTTTTSEAPQEEEELKSSNTIEIELPTPADDQTLVEGEEDISPIENIEKYLHGDDNDNENGGDNDDDDDVTEKNAEDSTTNEVIEQEESTFESAADADNNNDADADADADGEQASTPTADDDGDSNNN